MTPHDIRELIYTRITGLTPTTRDGHKDLYVRSNALSPGDGTRAFEVVQISTPEPMYETQSGIGNGADPLGVQFEVRALYHGDDVQKLGEDGAQICNELRALPARSNQIRTVGVKGLDINVNDVVVPTEEWKILRWQLDISFDSRSP